MNQKNAALQRRKRDVGSTGKTCGREHAALGRPLFRRKRCLYKGVGRISSRRTCSGGGRRRTISSPRKMLGSCRIFRFKNRPFNFPNLVISWCVLTRLHLRCAGAGILHSKKHLQVFAHVPRNLEAAAIQIYDAKPLGPPN